MRVIINGEAREIASMSVDALLGELDYEGTHFAIAVNYDVLPKSRWAETQLKSGDEIEIITKRQGGGGWRFHSLFLLISPSSLRTRGPITTGLRCNDGRLPSCQQARSRGMGPGVRRDDGEINPC